MKRSGRLSYHLCRLLLGGVFVWAGAVKALDVPAFAGQVAAYRLLPYAWNYAVASTLPYVELLAGALLLANQRLKPAALLLGVLNGLFIVVLLSVLARGLQIDCGCFGPDAGTTPLQALGRDVVLLALAVAVYRQHDRYAPPAGP
ncbi:MAG: DoxX family protein [Deltaproteobacteria bacterium]|nr:MAG: DoxX family protein [Deltaproteobacteria bacterium]